MFRALISFCLIAILAASCQAFIFHDPGAYTQRATQIVQHMGKWSDQLGKMNTQIQKFQEYQQKFQEYYGKFQEYKAVFSSVYRKISSHDWANLVTTLVALYEDKFKNRQPDDIDYSLLEDTEYLTENSLYQESASYRAHVDALIDRHQSVVENIKRLDEQMRSIREVQNARLEKLNEFERINKEMSYDGSGEAAITEQMALLNQMMLEQLRMAHEQETVLRVLLEKQLEAEKAAMEAKVRTAETNANRRQNMEQINRATGASTPGR